MPTYPTLDQTPRASVPEGQPENSPGWNPPARAGGPHLRLSKNYAGVPSLRFFRPGWEASRRDSPKTAQGGIRRHGGWPHISAYQKTTLGCPVSGFSGLSGKRPGGTARKQPRVESAATGGWPASPLIKNLRWGAQSPVFSGLSGKRPGGTARKQPRVESAGAADETLGIPPKKESGAPEGRCEPSGLRTAQSRSSS